MPSGIYIRTKEHKRKMGEAHKGIKLSKKHKKKISDRKKGRRTSPDTEFKKGHKINLGRKLSPFTDEHRKNMSKVRIGKKHTEEHSRKIGEALKGEKSSFWRGGISFEPYGIGFNKRLKEQIRKRDKHICQICGWEQGKRKFDIHHIDYNKKNNNMRNLITLCNSCHSKTQTKRDSWQLFFGNEMKTIYKLLKVG